MKRDRTQQILNVVLLLSIVGATWIVMPYVGVFNQVVRVFICGSAVVIGGFYLSSNKKMLLSYGRLPKAMRKALVSAEKRFVSAIEFLQSNSIKQQSFESEEVKKNRGKLYSLPWYLVIGPSGSGKSSLLSHSKLTVLLRKKKSSNLAESPFKNHCQWWGTEQAVLMECNSQYFSFEKKMSAARIFWVTFLTLLRKYKRTSLSGVIITLSLEEILLESKQRQNLYFQSVRKRLLDIQKHLKTNLPVYIVFTKADCLSGFNEFFDTLNQQERDQLWGVSFSQKNLSTSQLMIDCFDTEFDLLLKRLNERLITRLQLEQNEEKRFLIKDFPLQIESLKKQFALLVKTISDISTLKSRTKLRGIYLTSAEPKDNTIDRLVAPLNKTFALSTHVEKPEKVFQRNFFCKSLFHNVIFKDKIFFQSQLTTERKIHKFVMPMMTVTGCLLLGIVTSYWLGSFNQKIASINQAQEKIAQYKLLAEQADFTKANQALPALDMLAQTLSILSAKLGSDIIDMGKGRHQQLINTANDAYFDVMQIFLSYQLQGEITRQMMMDNGVATDLYSALKTYLMLGSPERSNQQYMTYWFHQFWQQQLPNDPKRVEQLDKHLLNYLQSHVKPLAINQPLVADARNVLRQQAPAEVVFAIILNELLFTNEVFSIAVPQGAGLHRFFDYPGKVITIPAIYSRAYFSRTIETLIPKAIQILQDGNGILTGLQQENGSFSTDYIIEESQKLYMAQYIKAWGSVINQLNVEDFSSFEHGIQLVDSLSNAASHLAALLDLIHQNTDITYHNVQTPISIKFQKLNHLFNQYPNSDILELRANLLRLNDVLLNIANAKNPQYAAFSASLAKMQSPENSDVFYQLEEQAKNLPAPLDQWTQRIVENSWGLMLEESRQYLNLTWQASIVPYYNLYIKNHYPIEKNAIQEISESHFTDFFGPHGQLAHFYSNLIKPFIDFSEGQWRWKQIHHQELGLSDDTLEQFQLGVLIQSLFYPEDSKNPQVSFMLKAKAKNPDLVSVMVDVDSKQIDFNHQRAAKFNWPGDMLMHASTITMIQKDGKKMVDTETGFWGWFKLLDKSKHIKASAPNKMDITFAIENNQIDFEIVSTNIVNPFSPDFLRSFECSEQLG